jgi:outer membrane receptor protein involved in Fe transport
LLAGTGLAAERRPEGVYVLKAAAAPARPRPPEALPVGTVEEAPASEAAGPGPELRAETIIVTGTSLRGFAPESSPLQVYSRDDILASGVTSTEQFIRTLPQNFGGGSSEFAPGGLPNDFVSTRNDTLGTGPNIRGLGSGGTLVLLNGARLAPSSSVGNFVDLSLIPVSALERVDVLTDGASSIYGGDAVAGVMNFVLRRDFEGSETSLRRGAVTSGDLTETRLAQALGTAWSGGSLMGTYEYYQRGNLRLSDRPEIAPPATTNGIPIPDPARFDLLPEQERHSAVLSASQQFGPVLFTGSGLYSIRETANTTILAGTVLRLQESAAESENISASLRAEMDLSDRWSAALGATIGRITNAQSFRQSTTAQPPTVVANSRAATDSGLDAIDFLLNGEPFRLPGGQVRVAFGGQLREETFDYRQVGGNALRSGQRDVKAAFAELLLPLVGADNRLPGAERLEVNLSGRIDDYSDFGRSENPKIGLLWSPVAGLNLRGSYSTSFSPPALGFAGDLTRGGLVAPYRVLATALGQPVPPGLDTDFLFLSGTADNLQPETSRTFTGGVDYKAERGSHLWSARATYYDTSFEGRLGQTPIPGNVNFYIAPAVALADPSAFPAGTITLAPSQAEIDAALASVTLPLNIAFGGSIANIGIINRVNLVRNLATTETRGLDVQLQYGFESAIGQVSAGLNANYILDFDRQASSATPVVSSLNTFLNPVDLTVRASAGLARKDFSGTVFVNHVAGYRTNDTASAEPIGSWTTVDAHLAYTPQAEGWLGGTRLSLSVQNLMDEPPPRTPSVGTSLIAGYDPANASPLGRFVALEISKSF